MTMLVLAVSCATRMNDSRVDSLLRDYQGDVPGAAVLVVHDGHIVHRAGYGLADLDARTPVTPQTNFRLASVSKQFTAAAIEKLAARGALAYDDPITRFLPSLPLYAQSMTIRQLLTHTSGLPDYEDLIPREQTTQVSDRDVLHLLEKTDRPLFAPGSKYQYSNSGYVLLGLIVARASSLSFADFLKREIFDPLGMRGTQIGPPPQQRAYGHAHKSGAWVRHDQSVTSATQGDGGIYSSIDDMVKWDASLPPDPPPFTVPTDDPRLRYGFGWRYSEHRGHRTQWHSGETAGFRNVIVRFPDDRLTVIMLTNRDDPEPYQTALRIADLYLP
jgi:CubicO group peptidase (beta-lactamase class C family)